MMNKNPKKKLCWNCEGNVSVVEETCPYCGVSIVPASLDNPSTRFSPPYNPSSVHEGAIPRSPYAPQEDKESGNSEKLPAEVEENEESLEEFKKVLISVCLLLAGSVFFLFGLALALFSRDGLLILQWNGNLWYIYTGLSLAMLLLGWRALLKIEEEKS
jgi:hypothetical protein